MTTSMEQYLQLKDKLKKYSDSYYNDNVSLVTDSEYDALYRQLLSIEQEHPKWVKKDSPSKNIGFTPNSPLVKVPHSTKLYSLENVFNIDELNKFLSTLGTEEYIIEPKYDGLAVAVRYKSGLLHQIITRGDGEIGEDVTHNSSLILDLPKHIPTHLDVEIRGEIVMYKEDLLKYNMNVQLYGGKLLSNPRNAASGTLRAINNTYNEYRVLHFRPYDIVLNDFASNNILLLESTLLDYLSSIGFKSMYSITTDKNRIPEYINELYNSKVNNLLPFDIDGVVIKVNNLLTRPGYGYTEKYPKFAIAYKFPAEEVLSVVEDIIVQAGRTGVLTPVAKIKPVMVGGVTVSSVTLHNYNYVKTKDIRIGDTVIVHRAGEVIPEIISVVLDKRPENTVEWVMPKTCPYCDNIVIPSQSYHICIGNVQCKAQKLRRLEHFVSRQGMNIVGMSTKILQALIDNKLINGFSSIYKLTKKDLLTIDKIGDISSDKLLEAINNSKNPRLENFINALGIEGVGISTAKKLVKRFHTWDNIINATKEELCAVDDVGDITANNLKEGLSNILVSEDIALVAKIVQPKESTSSTGPLSNKLVCITGKTKLTRNILVSMIEALGGTFTNTINSKLNYLIVGDSPGSKLNKAISNKAIVIKNEDWLTGLYNELNQK